MKKVEGGKEKSTELKKRQQMAKGENKMKQWDTIGQYEEQWSQQHTAAYLVVKFCRHHK